MRRRNKNVPDDSDESDSASANSDSDATVSNKRVNKKKQPQKKRGRPAGRTNAKRRRVSDSAESDTSPQPSCSTHNQNSPNSDDSQSESESEDSDYGPVKDRGLRKKTPGKRGRPSKKPDNAKKQKAQNNSVNGVSSNKRSETHSQLNASNRKSTTSNEVTFDTKQVESLAQKVVYFLLVEDQKKCAIRRKAITAHVFKDEIYSPKLYTAVIKKANLILKKVYGMELMELENQKDSYLIVNILGRELGIHDYVEVSKLKQQQHGLILYLLTVIFMNDNAITEDELTKALKTLGIDLTTKKLHPVFGDVKKYITSDLVKQMYLTYETVSKDPPKYEIRWGLRAKQEFDKRDLLQFTCQIMDETTPESWRMQYNDAEKSANPTVNRSS